MKALLVLGLTLVSSAAFAWSDPSNEPTRTHVWANSRSSCDGLNNSVRSHGAVILHYGDGLFERVVSSQAYCSSAGGDTAEPFWLNGCFVGYTCEHMNGG